MAEIAIPKPTPNGTALPGSSNVPAASINTNAPAAVPSLTNVQAFLEYLYERGAV